MEDLLPPPVASGSGYERTGVRQFTIFLENRVGRLTTLLRALEESDQCINAISVEESADTALVRLICSDPDDARDTLVRGKFAFGETDVLVVALPHRNDRPLLSITTALLAAEINIHYVYSMLRAHPYPAAALYVDDPTLASQLLIRRGFKLISESDLAKECEGDRDEDDDDRPYNDEQS